MTGENPPKGYDPNDKLIGDADDLIWMEFESPSLIEQLTAEDYSKALTELKLTENQRDMLRIHYAAPAHVITARQLARAMGYNSWTTTNIHYGRLGRLVGEKLGLPPDTKLAALCAFHKAAGEEWEFIQHPSLVAALERLGIVSGDLAPMQEEMAACMVGVVLSAFFCNSEEAGVEGPMAASAFLFERQTSKEFPHPHRQRR